MFSPLPNVPDHNGLELEILELWERADTFGRLRRQNLDGPKFRFIDGPVTANKTLAVHTAWGRTLKDVFQRYKALRGFHQRYQNGFDCQGLWIEVAVEKELGLNSKREIEEYGLEKFAEKCRDSVVRYAKDLTEGSIRLGQWMDWGNDYLTFSDTNIEYIWRFLKIVHERNWLYRGHRATEWCPRCGTSISAHELIGSYVDRTDPALSVRFPLIDRPGEAIVIWTTTPWTLPANVAAAVNVDADYGRLPNGDWIAVARAGKNDEFIQTLRGEDLVGWRYTGPFDDMEGSAAGKHVVVAWDEVALDEGTGIVHIAPGCGTEDFELGKDNDLPIVIPVDEAGNFYPAFGWLAGRNAHEAADDIIDDLRTRDLLVAAGKITHRYPECWRCHTPLIFRISDDWFIALDEMRQPMRDANAKVEWTPDYMGRRMDDWLVNMGDWNISRRRYYGLPLPFYPCDCGELTVVGSKEELAQLATGPIDGLEQLRRPWVDRVQITCPACGKAVSRIIEVGDVWLDAGIVPFSTLGWMNDRYIEGGYATGAAAGLTTADLPNHEYWEEWFPADWVSEMREQIRLWFYSQLCMSVVLTGEAPYRKVLGYEKMLDETGREMHGSWGNTIEAPDAFERMGADVMRWQFSMQPPNQNLLFGFGPAYEIQRKLLTLWNSVTFFIQYANIAAFSPSTLDAPTSGLEGLDEWLIARTHRLVAEATEGYEAFLSPNVLRAFDDYVEDLSNWYVRRSRKRFWNGDPGALSTLWFALVTALRVVSPVMPFLAEHLWQNLVTGVLPDASDSVFLAGWPAQSIVDRELLDEVAEMRQVVELARQARAQSGIRNRQPLRRLVVDGAARAERHAQEIADELRVKEVVFGPIEATELRVRPNLPVLGPRFGKELGKIRAALQNGEFEQLDDGGFRVLGNDLTADEVLVEKTQAEGWVIASNEGVSVGLDTALDDELVREGRVNDLVHHVNVQRKDVLKLEITDRVRLWLAATDADLMPYAERVASETLAVSVELSDGEMRIELAAD
ncbi:MAG: isoleucyl-tRNA synthetase [Actinomycetota bacterium]|jgi:isoleucyl-tRNA synthetase